ncbi:MAG: DEAD/DEAH box helicase family protein [Devosia sp.]|uniref:DEAD/DEAH box helicase family protein n=1 Tax=Devosia sp. TaxID=1871048 RepID=UPI001A3AFD31|nr:DEAD/DEAH box helicase family protein [Devosia sp.]MBL8599935.1 DEAD/DEAH box helicase family protein [Devosia sp.]
MTGGQSLIKLNLRRTYHKGRGKDDIARDFYLPALAVSRSYDRAVGYFSSSIYLLAWPSLRQFVENGGKIRLLCSPVLSADDENAMRQGYSDRANEALAVQISAQFAQMLSSPSLMKPTTVLASLIASGVIDVRIAWVSAAAEGRVTRIFHDKLGILEDTDGNRVAFKGSMNETWPALSLDGNIESIDVFASWRDDSEQQRIEDEAAYFEDLWNDRWQGARVKPLPESARSEIISAAEPDRWVSLVEDICTELDHAAMWSIESDRQGGRMPRAHQVEALDAWTASNRRGILEHATGSGKTFTALCAIGASLRLREIPLIAVPSELLLEQWETEMREAFAASGLELLMCGAGNDRWRSNALLRNWTRALSSDAKPRAVLTTIQTASSPQFLGLCAWGAHIFMVADEVHRLGAVEARGILAFETGPRLGLSATPTRAGDPDGTSAVLSYFERVVQPPFTLQDAILVGTLTPYAYHPMAIELEADEQVEWQRLTKEIRRLTARHRDKDQDAGAGVRLKILQVQRARVAKGARRKVAAAVAIVVAHYRPDERWIIYCDDQSQLAQIATALRAAGVRDVFEYHSAMRGDRRATLTVFGERGGVVVSIRCLDEGVDIPAVTHALILASSRNPREFIQRRGRVLRRFPGKYLAHVFDVLVTPSIDLEERGDFDGMLEGELARAIEFGRHAINPAAISDLERIAVRMGIESSVALEGFEDDYEQDGAGAVNG